MVRIVRSPMCDQCPDCSGRGYHRDKTGEIEGPCATCRGLGLLRGIIAQCGDCWGRGRSPAWDDDHGWHLSTCEECNGRGVVEMLSDGRWRPIGGEQ